MSAAAGLLAALRRHPAVRTVDLALAGVLRRHDAATDERVLAGAALASLAVGTGYAAFDPARPELLLEEGVTWPDADAWRRALTGSRWVSTPGHDAVAPTDAPLVFEHGLLYLRRYREYERRLAAGLQRIAARRPEAAPLPSLSPLFTALFPDARNHDLQARAAALALLRSLMLVTGGPGTGKTTTIARLLLLLLAQARWAGAPPPRIALAAPTGRAAERMADSLRKASLTLAETAGVDATLCAALPTEASTLHRLLGTIPDSPHFRFGAAAPLPFDVIVVDEASMVDLPLMCKLVEAVPDGARLVLLGDPDQLPSVEAGDVLAAILAAAGEGDRMAADAAAALAPLLGAVPAPAAASPPSSLAGHRVQLLRGYRQSEALQLAPLAEAVRRGDADAALAMLRGGRLPGVHFHQDRGDVLVGDPGDSLLGHWRSLCEESDPARALRRAGEVRVLTALRDGPQGAATLNARIEEALAGGQRAPYFHGRLLLITENSYRHRLFNGDIGICLRDDNGSMAAWFSGRGSELRALHPATLPAHAGAFAMTVHKAQGSEFDDVWLLLPQQDARPLSRELVYTAITRARRSVHLCAGEGVLRAALQRHAARVSGLAQRLNTRVPAISA